MDYSKLDSIDFDAMVTGELVHQAMRFEVELIGIISDHFVVAEKKHDFERLLLHRDGLSFNDKIEIVRAMSPLLPDAVATRLRKCLDKVAEFIPIRNAFSHGTDALVPGLPEPAVSVQVYSRSGKPRTITVTPEDHQRALESWHTLLIELQECRRLAA